MKLSRRTLLQGAALAAACATTRRALAVEASARPPVLYVSHGSPFLLTAKERVAELRAWGARLPKPTGIVSMTPHYGLRRVDLGAVGPGLAVYSLPKWIAARLPQGLTYPTPTNEALVAAVKPLLPSSGEVHAGLRRGLDHTTWMPLRGLFPEADVPVLEIAYPYVKERELFDLGVRLAPLRDRGVLFLASGGMTHNLASANLEGPSSTPAWSSDFDTWAKEALERRDVDALLDWRHKSPSAGLAHPDDGAHYRVLLFALGLAWGAAGSGAPPRFPISGFESTLSRRCVELA